MATSRPAVGATERYDLDGFVRDIGDIPVITDPMTIRRRSRDFFWYSPILNEQLHGKAADIVAAPRDEDEIVRIAKACAKHRIPLCVRAGGTGNYGQMVPLEGGVLLDINELSKIEWSKPGLVRAQAGARMHDMDAELRPAGWELRMHPSTKRMATIGGFVSGGSGGIGSVTYGGLREPGNIIAARVVTLEDEPRVLDLRGEDVLKINRSYGTTGIVTALEMPLAPAWSWIDVVIAFDDYAQAMETGLAIAQADGIVKKLITPMMWPVPQHFAPMTDYCPEGKSVIFAMIAEPSMEAFRILAHKSGEITYEKPNDESPNEIPLYEYTWNHTTLQWLKQDRGITYLQCLFPADRLLESAQQMREMFPDEVLPHAEFMRFNGRVTCSALPIVRYTTAERLNEIIELHEKNGVFIANPHVYTLEDGTRHKRTDADQFGFKAEVDPYGLLNPGKMRTYVPVRD